MITGPEQRMRRIRPIQLTRQQDTAETNSTDHGECEGGKRPSELVDGGGRWEGDGGEGSVRGTLHLSLILVLRMGIRHGYKALPWVQLEAVLLAALDPRGIRVARALRRYATGSSALRRPGRTFLPIGVRGKVLGKIPPEGGGVPAELLAGGGAPDRDPLILLIDHGFGLWGLGLERG